MIGQDMAGAGSLRGYREVDGGAAPQE